MSTDEIARMIIDRFDRFEDRVDKRLDSLDSKVDRVNDTLTAKVDKVKIDVVKTKEASTTSYYKLYGKFIAIGVLSGSGGGVALLKIMDKF